MFDSKLLKQVRVLYVEDDETIRESLSSLFQKLFCEVIVAVDGQDGYEKFKSEFDKNQIIDIVISDITMPRMDGIEMLKLIKKLDYSIPFILTTAYSDVEYFKEAIKLNVTHYAIKPINIKDVMLHVQEISEVKFQDRGLKQKQKELEEYLKAIDQVALISKTNKDGIIKDVNEMFCETSGYCLDELVGQNHNIIRHPDTPSKTFKELWTDIVSGKIWKGKLKNQTKDKENYFINTTIIPIYDKYDDEIDEYISISFLTTKDEEERREFKKQVIKNMGEIKKDYSLLKKENQDLKDRFKIVNHMDLLQIQLNNERDRNKKSLNQIKHYEKEIEKLNSRYDKLILEGKSRLNVALEEIRDLKRSNDALNRKLNQSEARVIQQEESILRLENNITVKRRKIDNLYDVIDYRESQLTKLGLELEPHKNEEED